MKNRIKRFFITLCCPCSDIPEDQDEIKAKKIYIS